jgi:hypothetical protein
LEALAHNLQCGSYVSLASEDFGETLARHGHVIDLFPEKFRDTRAVFFPRLSGDCALQLAAFGSEGGLFGVQFRLFGGECSVRRIRVGK